MLIPRITSEMLRTQPDQTVKVINSVIDKCNKLEQIIQRNGLQ